VAARIDTRAITTSALLAALIAVCAMIALPFGAVPGTLQIFAVVLTALVVPPGWAALAVGTYLLAGAVGLPVFAGFTGGFGVLLGPTGGFLWGFLLGAVAGSWVRIALTRRGTRQLLADALAAAVVIVCAYVLGWAQLAFVAGLGPAKALVAGVVPFVIPDVIKAALALAVAAALRRAHVVAAV
jgi:biotin transport system substrate-specific component